MAAGLFFSVEPFISAADEDPPARKEELLLANEGSDRPTEKPELLPLAEYEPLCELCCAELLDAPPE